MPVPLREVTDEKHISGTVGVITLIHKGDGHLRQDATAKSVEFGNVVPRLVSHLDGGVARRFTQSLVFRLVGEDGESTTDRVHEIVVTVSGKEEAVRMSLPGEPVVHCLLETSRVERDHGRSRRKELVLYDTARLKQRWHQSVVCREIAHKAIGEELVWIGPEAVAVVGAQVVDLVDAVPSVGIALVSNASEDDLDVAVPRHN